MSVRVSRRRLSLVSLAAALAWTASGMAQQQERSQVPDKFKWNLADIYASDQAWRTAKDALVAELPKLHPFQGALGTSAQKLADALDLSNRLSKEFARLYVYASMTSDQDTRVATYQAMQQEMVQMGAKFGAETAFIEPEILKVDPG